ncbi:hypothetical protein ACWGI8_20910 [Streptomyces sp. NPDC054841]
MAENETSSERIERIQQQLEQTDQTERPETTGDATPLEPDTNIPGPPSSLDARQANSENPAARAGRIYLEERCEACRRLLLRLSGLATDELMVKARQWLADQEWTNFARGVAFEAVRFRIPLDMEDLALLDRMLLEAGADRTALDGLELREAEPLPMFVFTTDPDPAPDGDWSMAPPTLFVTSDPRTEGTADPVDDTAVSAVRDSALGLWRSWRHAADGSTWPRPERVYVVEVPAGAEAVEMVELTARVQSQLAAVAGQDVQVEVVATREVATSYQVMARNYGLLLWDADGRPGMQVAGLFDRVDPERGPLFDPSHPRLPNEEALKVAAYLREGRTVVNTTERMPDVLAEDDDLVVPLGFSTDGYWVWNDASLYYLEQHGLAPTEGLLAHVKATGYQCPSVDGAGLHRAMAAILDEPSDEPAWTLGDPVEVAGEASSEQARDEVTDKNLEEPDGQ